MDRDGAGGREVLRPTEETAGTPTTASAAVAPVELGGGIDSGAGTISRIEKSLLPAYNPAKVRLLPRIGALRRHRENEDLLLINILYYTLFVRPSDIHLCFSLMPFVISHLNNGLIFASRGLLMIWVCGKDWFAYNTRLFEQ